MMKKLKFLAMTFMVISLFSCKKDKPNDGEIPGIADEGTPTFVTFDFNTGNTTSIQGVTPTPPSHTTVQENTIQDLCLLVFKTGANPVCEFKEIYQIEGGTNTKSVEITSGSKRIFILANVSGNLKIKELLDKITKGSTTLFAFYALYADFGTSVSESDLTLTAIDLSPLHAFDGGSTPKLGYFMSNIADAASNKEVVAGISLAQSQAGDENANHFTFNIQKAVAKIKVAIPNANVLTVQGGSLANMRYTIRNINRAMFPVQQYANDFIAPIQPTDNTTMPKSPFYSLFVGMNDTEKKNPATYKKYYYSLHNIDLPLTTTTDFGTVPGVIVNENTSEVQYIGNTTYAAIEGVFTPASVVSITTDANTESIETTENTGHVGSTFVTIDVSGLYIKNATSTIFYVTDVAAAEATLTEIGAFASNVGLVTPGNMGERIKTYQDGKCYYRLNIGNNNGSGTNRTIYGVKRNRIYQCSVSKINGLGVSTPTELEKDPETPVDKITNITADITVADWVIINQDGEI